MEWGRRHRDGGGHDDLSSVSVHVYIIYMVTCYDVMGQSSLFQRGTNFQSRIVSTNVTKSGNLVVHTAAPFTAAQLQEHRNDIKRCSDAIPDVEPPSSCTPVLELDVPWHGIVVHDLLAVSLSAAFEGDQGDDGESLGIWEAIEKEAGIPQEHIWHVQMLCRYEDQENRDL